MEQATFAAGCFWGVEAAFRQVGGVRSTVVGYSGGTTENPTYEHVSTGTTGHAEVVQLEYDPEKVTYDHLLDVFFRVHDPAQLDGQEVDVGSQYRSAIFHHTPQQQAAAERAVQRLRQSRRYKRRVVTEVAAAGPFYRAEEYHQRYVEKRGLSSCESD